MSFLSVWWEDPWFLVLLLCVPLLLWRSLSLRTPVRIPMPSNQHLRSAGQSLVSRAWWIPDALRMLAIAALVVGLARPQWEEERAVEGEGIDIMLVLDMSISMNFVDSTEARIERLLNQGQEPENRFEAARTSLKSFVTKRQGDRVGLVVFGDKAWLKYPLTLDYSRVNRTLDDLVLDDGGPRLEGGGCSNRCTVTGEATTIGDGLARALARLERSKAKSRVIILVTDGEHNRGRITPQALVREIRDKPEYENVDIYTFLVGSSEQAFQPHRDPRSGRPVRRRNGTRDYVPVGDAAVNPDLLRELAEVSGGHYYASYNAQKMHTDMADLEKSVTGSNFMVHRSDIFMRFVMVGLGLLFLEWLLRFTRFRRLA